MYANGAGTKQDFFEAALWFRQAADRGIPEAQYNLSLAYELGQGVGKDEPAAQRWYRQAATQGYGRARFNLALMLKEGRGSPVDVAAALTFYRAGAEQNFAPAQNNLGILLAEGRGVAANLAEAYSWLSLAVENGAKPTGRDLVARQLSPAQLAEAGTAVARLRAALVLTAPAASAASTPPPARPSTPINPPAPATPPADPAGLNARLAAIQSELERFRVENGRLAVTAQTLAQKKAALEQRLATAAPAARDKFSAQIASLEKAQAEAQTSSTRLAAENNPFKTAASRSTQNSTLTTLRTQVEQLTRTAETLRDEKTKAERQAEQLAAELKAARNSAAAPA